ncbi:sensor histidine kinase [Pelagibacterium luteolum]|uniref:histidine kinase n=1 Tax=Pelagibacterium luteolum TaxID=440168 RepID=A0A1G7SR53_9HYPH|nr:sensor histidine kinase [Pelagibacterium luteolum]SDG25513.1 two-component system, OmpR family, sensor histidine kinase ChvG [Pelagibacterium luteolum]
MDASEPIIDREPVSKGEQKARAAEDRRAARRPFMRPVFAFFRGIGRVINFTFFSSLTRRIVILNLVALAALVAGIMYLNSFRSGLIDVRVSALRVQGEIIAAAIAASATADSTSITVNPDRLLELYMGEYASPYSLFDPTLEFPISPERVAPLLRNLVTPTGTRARIYGRDGMLILDSNNIFASGEILGATDTSDVPEEPSWWDGLGTWFSHLLRGGNYPLYLEHRPHEGLNYPEVAAALNGSPADIVRVDPRGQLVVSVAIPVQRQRNVVGALLLSTSPGEIDAIVAQERWSILRLALVASLVTGTLSALMAGTIAGPMRRLSAAADRVQSSMKARAEIPDYTDRSDEIGHLSGSLRAMTNALYNRIEAIERFAADVAHELKNPLTSLRSAVETLPLAKNERDRQRLVDIIQHDVRRLDRLISDISNASRIDAELARENTETVDLGQLAEAIVSIQSDLAASRGVNVVLANKANKLAPLVKGHDTRLAQVFTNLIDNAVSFSPEGGTVTVEIGVDNDTVWTKVLDEGPGITGDTEKVFQRFYTDRPEGESFGDHSGLGLSISRQIAQAHQGTLDAGNRTDATGAVFTFTLPRAKS